MNRETINPVDWGLTFNMGQGELVEGCTRLLHFSSQSSITQNPGSGVSVTHPSSLRAQIQNSLESIDAVLNKAGMSRSNVLTLRFFTTDIDNFLKNYDVYANWIGAAGVRPPQSLFGVNQLVSPEMMVEVEAVAGE